MKKVLTIFAVVVLMMGNKAGAQITFEHTFYRGTARFYITDLGNNDIKYVFDQDTTGFKIYNPDFTLYLNVITPLLLHTAPHYYEVAYISNSLFDCDSTNIEYVITSSNTPGNFYVYRTNGNLLFERDSVTGPYAIGWDDGSIWTKPIFNTPTGTKLWLFNNSGTPDSVYVYSLCGTLPLITDEFDFHQQQQSYVKVFPNPTSNTLTFQINPPDNMNEYELVVVDGNAREVRREKVGGSRTFTMDVRDLAGGSYFYSLCTKDRAFGNGKFVINK